MAAGRRRENTFATSLVWTSLGAFKIQHQADKFLRRSGDVSTFALQALADRAPHSAANVTGKASSSLHIPDPGPLQRGRRLPPVPRAYPTWPRAARSPALASRTTLPSCWPGTIGGHGSPAITGLPRSPQAGQRSGPPRMGCSPSGCSASNLCPTPEAGRPPVPPPHGGRHPSQRRKGPVEAEISSQGSWRAGRDALPLHRGLRRCRKGSAAWRPGAGPPCLPVLYLKQRCRTSGLRDGPAPSFQPLPRRREGAAIPPPCNLGGRRGPPKR